MRELPQKEANLFKQILVRKMFSTQELLCHVRLLTSTFGRLQIRSGDQAC